MSDKRKWWSGEKTPDQIADEINQRRIAREKAVYERGFPVAGHDLPPAQEAENAALREIEKGQRSLDAKAAAAEASPDRWRA